MTYGRRDFVDRKGSDVGSDRNLKQLVRNRWQGSGGRTRKRDGPSRPFEGVKV